MIRVLKIAVALAVLWSLWWLAAGYGVRTGIANWFAEQRDRGWQAEYGQLQTSGYPSAHHTRLEQPTLADPNTGVAWRADWLDLSSPAARPGQQTVLFPDTDQRLSYFDQTFQLNAAAMRADLHVSPSASFQVQTMTLSSADWIITGPKGPLLSGECANLSMTQAETPETYTLQGQIDALQLLDAGHEVIPVAQALSTQADALSLDATIRFSRPWDLTAISQARPQPRMIKLSLAQMKWGNLELLAAGQLDIDPQGTPTGALTIKAENWRDMLAIATKTGALPNELAKPLEQVLTLLARTGGNPQALDIKLTFRNGRMYSGLLPLGPAPRLLLR